MYCFLYLIKIYVNSLFGFFIKKYAFFRQKEKISKI